MNGRSNPARVFTEKHLDIFDIEPLDASNSRHVLPPEEYRCMLDNIHRDDVVETYEWVVPARYTIEYRNLMTEEEWIARSDAEFYDCERPKNHWEREEDYEDWYGDDWKDTDHWDKPPIEEEMT